MSVALSQRTGHEKCIIPNCGASSRSIHQRTRRKCYGEMDGFYFWRFAWLLFFILYNLFYTSNGENVNHWSWSGLIRNKSHCIYPYKYIETPNRNNNKGKKSDIGIEIWFPNSLPRIFTNYMFKYHVEWKKIVTASYTYRTLRFFKCRVLT